MKKEIKAFIAICIMAVAFVGCQTDAQQEVSKPIADATAKTDNAANKANNNLQPTAAKKAKANAQKTLSDDRPKTKITFDEMEHHFGTINEGDKVEHIFTFTNTGSEPLILEKCKGSCGCTVPTCPSEPILPGGKGEIKVVFNSRGKRNHQEKRVTITANTEPQQTVLKIIADVTPDPEAEAKRKAKQAAKDAKK